MTSRRFQGNAKYYRVVDGIRNYEQIPMMAICYLPRVNTVRLVDVFGNDTSTTVKVR